MILVHEPFCLFSSSLGSTIVAQVRAACNSLGNYRSVLLVLALPNRAMAQAVGCSISGTVKDAQGAAIPDVTAVFTNTKTCLTTTVLTNHDGLYRGSNLQPGVYDLKVTLAGFSTGIRLLID
jgi:hypothetical protein